MSATAVTTAEREALRMPGFGDMATWPGLTSNPNDPRNDDPHYMSADDAEEIAQSQCMASGYDLAWSLGELCDYGEPDDVDMLCRHGFDAHGKSAQTLLAVMFNADKPADILAARAALREMIAAETSMREAVAARAEALQKEGWL